jgi:tetratricopeptide (TPR) repeat protein
VRSPLLSAALIVRNEERFLDGCLASLAGRVDEIVVVDTGSTDRTRAIAQDHGARLLDTPWRGDFAAARNTGLAAARGDWILYIDADERLVEFDRAAVEALCADPAYACHTVLFRPVSGYTRYREYRLFRNRPDLRFRGLIHETILPDLDALVARESLRVGASDVALDHVGYDGDQRHKHERNRPLLEARLALDPRHVYSRDHLGRTLLGLGDEAGAEAAWREAIATVRTLAAPTPVDSLPYLHLASFLLDRKRDAAALLDEGCRRFPENHALTWLSARRLVEAGRHADALPLFRQLAAVDTDACADGRLAFDRSIFGAHAHAAMGLCALKLGRADEAAAHYARAEALAPDDLEIRTKRQWAASLAQRGSGR